MTSDVRFRLDELAMVLDTISKVRPQLAERVSLGGGSMSQDDVKEMMGQLQTLYSIIGAGADKYAALLKVVAARVGNVSRLPGVDRRRPRGRKRGRAA